MISFFLWVPTNMSINFGSGLTNRMTWRVEQTRNERPTMSAEDVMNGNQAAMTCT